MPRLRALTSWSGRQAGEIFEASDTDARILCARDGIGGQRAERVLDRALEPTEPTTQERSEPTQSPSKQTEKRRYLRRDLRAQN